MKYYFIILLLYFSSNFLHCDGNNISHKITNDSNRQDVTFILKTALGNCLKCVVVSFDTFEKIKKDFVNKYNIKFIVFLICDREKEIRIFKKQYKFADSVLKYKKSMLTDEINNSDDMLFITDEKGKVLVSFDAFALSDFKKIKNKIKIVLQNNCN